MSRLTVLADFYNIVPDEKAGLPRAGIAQHPSEAVWYDALKDHTDVRAAFYSKICRR